MGEILKRLVSALLLSVVLGTTVAACAVDVAESDAAVRSVTVRPRVVIDGTVELADRTGGRIVIDAVVAHATDARVLDGADAIVVDDESIFFNFAPDHVADQVAAERVWQVPVAGGVIAMGFGPVDTDVAGTEVSGAAGIVGHTAVIHGTIAVSAEGFTAFGSVGEVDPDGTPANPRPADGLTGEVDPDGTPAKPVGEVDPDGTPARPQGDPDDKRGEIDPDGSPAKPGNVSAIDPDGTPARPTRGEVDPDGSPARNAVVKGVQKSTKEATKAVGFNVRGQVLVPFTLVIDGAFDYSMTLSAAELATVGENEVLPLDLRLTAADIFTTERLAALDALARAAVSSDRVEQGLAVAMSASATAPALQMSTTSGIEAVALEGEVQVDTDMMVSAVR